MVRIRIVSFPVLFVSALLFLTGCEKLFSESEAWRKQIGKDVQDLRKTATELKDAIPGERFMDRLMKAKVGNPEEQAKAKAEIAALYGLDPNVTYQATVWIEGLGHDEQLELAATFVPAPASRVLHQVLVERRENLIALASVGTAALTPEAAREEIKKAALAAIDALGGTLSTLKDGIPSEYRVTGSAWLPDTTFMQGSGAQIPGSPTGTRSGNVMFAEQAVTRASSDTGMTAIRKAAATKWMEAIAPVATSRLIAAPSFPVKWSPSLTDFLMVWVREKDWEKYQSRLLKSDSDKDAIRIRALLHKVGDQNQTYQLQPRRWFENRDFAIADHKVVDTTHGEVYRWASMDIAGNAPIAAERLRQMNAYLAAYERLGKSLDDITDGRPPPAKSWWQFWK